MTTSRRCRSNSWSRVLAYLLVAALCAVLASCSTPPAPPAPPAPPSGAAPLAGWKLTLPLAGKKGDAASVDPAAVSPPWLATDVSGNLLFWAPVNGETTPNSEHARTELVNLENFAAGQGQHTLTASVAVSQVPSGDQDVIIGQIHGADDISSVAFVMLHYQGGNVSVVVKQKQSGSSSTNLDLLSGVPLGARFDYGIRDNGDGSMTFTAAYGTQNASVNAPLPEPFQNATVRFQAGAYQQDSSKEGTADAADGARVTFYALSTGAAVPAS